MSHEAEPQQRRQYQLARALSPAWAEWLVQALCAKLSFCTELLYLEACISDIYPATQTREREKFYILGQPTRLIGCAKV